MPTKTDHEVELEFKALRGSLNGDRMLLSIADKRAILEALRQPEQAAEVDRWLLRSEPPSDS